MSPFLRVAISAKLIKERASYLGAKLKDKAPKKSPLRKLIKD